MSEYFTNDMLQHTNKLKLSEWKFKLSNIKHLNVKHLKPHNLLSFVN